jgi:hypothetical protein
MSEQGTALCGSRGGGRNGTRRGASMAGNDLWRGEEGQGHERARSCRDVWNVVVFYEVIAATRVCSVSDRR